MPSERGKHYGEEVTEALRAWRRGEAGGEERLFGLVYAELRRLASRFLGGERQDHTLQPTALVHEAYLRLIGQQRVDWRSRSHFFAICARLMRRILVDHARSRRRIKRGGEAEQIPFENLTDLAFEPAKDLTALDEALTSLSAIDPWKVRIVELRYFAGFTARETAEILGVSEPTVRRHWRVAKAWLYREVS